VQLKNTVPSKQFSIPVYRERTQGKYTGKQQIDTDYILVSLCLNIPANMSSQPHNLHPATYTLQEYPVVFYPTDYNKIPVAITSPPL